MNIELIRDYCLLKKGVTEGFPFNETTLVFKVTGKIFVLLNLEGDFRISLKCKPEKAIEIREHYPAVNPGYHLNKSHWNSVSIDGSIPDNLIYQWIDDSYNLVFNGLNRKEKQKILR